MPIVRWLAIIPLSTSAMSPKLSLPRKFSSDDYMRRTKGDGDELRCISLLRQCQTESLFILLTSHANFQSIRWFSVCMGTGIVSILLHNFPYPGRWLYWLSVIVFCLNVFLFIIFVTISITRYTVYRGIFHAMLRHPVQSLFLGMFPSTRKALI